MLVSTGAAVRKMRGALPMTPSVPAELEKFTVAGLPAVRARLASVRSAEFTPLAANVIAIVLKLWSSLTAPSVSVEAVAARFAYVNVPPRKVIGAASLTRSFKLIVPVFCTVSPAPALRSIEAVPESRAESVRVIVPPVISVAPV